MIILSWPNKAFTRVASADLADVPSAIDHFLDQKFITRESARDLSFRLAGLPDVYKAEPDELEKDAELNRKLTELETPVDPEGKPMSKSDQKP